MSRSVREQDGRDWDNDEDRPRGAHEISDDATFRDENYVEDDDASPASDTDNLSARSTGKHNKTAKRHIKKKTKRYPFNKDKELAVEAAMYWECFFDEMLPNEEVPVMIRRLPDENGWAKFKVSSLLGPPNVCDTRRHRG